MLFHFSDVHAKGLIAEKVLPICVAVIFFILEICLSMLGQLSNVHEKFLFIRIIFGVYPGIFIDLFALFLDQYGATRD